jgi:hypothetical protein
MHVCAHASETPTAGRGVRGARVRDGEARPTTRRRPRVKQKTDLKGAEVLLVLVIRLKLP